MRKGNVLIEHARQMLIDYGQDRIAVIEELDKQIADAAKIINEVSERAGMIGLGSVSIHKLASSLSPLGADFVFQTSVMRQARDHGWY